MGSPMVPRLVQTLSLLDIRTTSASVSHFDRVVGSSHVAATAGFVGELKIGLKMV